jgi:hypothetical protein
MNILVQRERLTNKLRQNPKRMSPKIIPLRLQQARRETFGTISIVETQCGAKRWNGYSQSRGFSNDVAPGRLGFVDRIVEEIVKQQVFQIWVFWEGLDELGKREEGEGRGTLVGFGDVAEEDGADDATASPHECDS